MRIHRLLVLLLGLNALSAAELAPLLGDVLRGDRLLIDKEAAVQIAGRRVPLARCDWLSTSDQAAWQQPELAIASQGILLRSGSYLPVERWQAAADGGHLQVQGPFGAMRLPLRQIRAWGIRSAVLAKRDLGSTDLIEWENGQQLVGELLAVQEQHLRVRSDLDDEPLQVPTDGLRLVVLHGADEPMSGLYLECVHDPQLPPVLLAPVMPWRLASLPKAELDASLVLPRLRVRGGATTMLSAIDPVSVTENGAFGVVWPHARDRLIDGSPIILGGQRYRHGVTIHSEASLVWPIDGAFIRFQSAVGIADALGFEGDCIVRIRIDDAEVWQARIRGGDAVRRVDIACDGGKRLQVVVEMGERYDIGDHVVFADARLIRK